MDFGDVSSLSSVSGVIGRDDGADLSWGRSVEHISHDRSEGWFRKVHAGQAMEFVVAERDPEGKDVEDDKAEVGRDLEWCWDNPEVTGVGTAVRGTPQSSQTRAADGLKPGGLRYAHTSHSQLSN